ncbi:MAG TPA: hypothetical protein VK066_28440 [Chloroflexota bacterium]|nr:hypothetical protein [Chloroflexota bacterium]
MRKLGLAAALLAAVFVTQPTAWASGQNQGADNATVTTMSPSQLIRQAGYTLTDAEAAYLDADQPIGQQWSTALMQVVALGGPNAGLPDSTMQPALEAVLQRLIALDPEAAPEAPPSLQPLRSLAVQQREATQRAAKAWLAALQAGDPNWWQAGAADLTLANQALQSWQQEMAARYPPPQGNP